MRHDGRSADQLRPVTITRHFTDTAPGSVLYQSGRTKVLCTASVEEGVPPWMMNSNRGWLTAEYSMLPSATGSRKGRDGRRGPVDGRSLEIGRLIGRSLRAAVDLTRLPGRTIWIDCDVLRADGGTRTASICGAMVATVDALRFMQSKGWLRSWAVARPVAAISVGVINGEPVLDLDYVEDSRAAVDLNVVMNSEGEFVELQGAGENGHTFSPDQLQQMLALAGGGVTELLAMQERALTTDNGAG